ncbi:MAG: NADH-quinone oxidoreductase subunit L [Muribaculaceae bacterium]|nr:NADH-quinone oxidoreductase subunit L [Muribaculaceae bacterium]
MDATIQILILAIPLFMFLFLGLLGKYLSHKLAGILGTTAMGIVTALAYYTAYLYFFSGDPHFQDGTQRLQYIVFNPVWLEFYGNLHINIGFLLDPISAMMLVVITTISFMVNLYSNAYMRDHHGVFEKGFQRYYAFLALFSFSMLGLVVATNIFQMYIFWELVGASSYLLIGFYYTSPAAVSASKKAFIVTRFADLGFLIGILVLSYYTGVFSFMDFTSAPVEGLADTFKISTDTAAAVLVNKFTASPVPMFMGCSVLTWALVLIFMGGMGKSAMLPLHIWLPDAMEGPTPVSALIHAATMVVAGVYLVARLFPLYLQETAALEIVTVVGALTAFYAAMVACAQVDIKRVLAFSTISQIAFMMVSLGVCRPEYHHGVGYMASMFHLFTHAMFKALLFLGAGALIHAVHSNNYTAMHGLRKYMPVTHWTFLIGCLAIAGIIPFSGFFSKDEILTACGEYSTLVYIWMSAVAALTAFYMFRLYFLIFWWKEHKVHDPHHAPHDQPWCMTLPLIFLALVSCVAGFIPFGDFVTFNGEEHTFDLDWTVAGISLTVALISIAVAAKMYMKENPLPDKMAAALPRLWDWCYHRFYWDELYMFITHRIIFGLVCKPIAWFDRHIIDGTMDAFAAITNKASCAIKGLQSGNVQTYVWVYLIGALLLGTVTYICLL